jgi:hypothetical protein
MFPVRFVELKLTLLDLLEQLFLTRQ